MESQHILIVGAGAVGQVYGYQMAKAGHKVAFLIREKYADTLNQGFTLYCLNQDRKRQHPIQFRDYTFFTDWTQAQQQRWDQIHLTISSTALRKLDLAAVKATLGDGTLGCLQPGPEDLALLQQTIPAEQIVQGVISLISYEGPLPGESLPQPGTVFLLPPMVATPFNGPAERCLHVIKTFRDSGMRAKHNPNLMYDALFPTAFFMAFLTALEASDWKFNTLRGNTALLQQMQAAQREAIQALANKHGIKPPFWRGLAFPPLTQLLLTLAPHALPMDLETYFKVHFTKVGDQTRLFMKTYIESARQQQLPHYQLETLAAMV